MAEASVLLVLDQFSCSICLDLLKDAVTIPCGHSYCMSCITDCWDQDDQKRVYSCPQCRQTFTPRPVLGKNTMLAEVVEKLKNTKLQAARPDLCYGEPGDVECDVCTERKHKAVKSCLVCLSSYCQNHLEQHENLFKVKKHKLIDATGRLQEMICPQHEKLLEIYCRTDQCCICYLCMVDEHRNHKTVSAAAERTEKQETQRTHQQRIQEKQKLHELREAVETHKCSALAAVEDTERVFTELIRYIERSRSEVIKLIRDQEKSAVSQAEELLKHLEQEIDDLKRRDAELEQLSHTDDHIHFLQSFQSLSVPPGSTDLLNITVSTCLSFDEVGKSVSHLKEKLMNFCREEIEKISARVMCIGIIPNPEPKIKEQFLQYFGLITADPNTAQKRLRLSEGNRVITRTANVQPYPDHPDRFDGCYQVLCRESVCGRCYWEVEWSGEMRLSVSYKSISRKGRGRECLFGHSDQSWSLFCSDSSSSFWHNNIETKLPVVSRSSRIGVYVDHSAGILSFYSVSDTMTLIHRVHTTFTQPLYPGFWAKGSVKLCDLTI
ncbi:tripartite motif-containing protein 16-like [Triplophysa dalaica]|uniref:tripartite motif-containing protein 16-like n=1 Tax=Triplophysa dalaica TaxID=1582913 RepID=UPI0024DF603B|nr:tripartite motif-containing protein 16-like [Triplophysa dalaica]XP_056598820.1 tripartite motif-containing protein 16-like [Triplophysa dalaica]XP_056598821.1 tripartite motif-containing protein 16-like [Triplophysa dalaica]XP_056598822.1 tripartite motif-containing protein 16-like [Triplophysa dalaica]